MKNYSKHNSDRNALLLSVPGKITDHKLCQPVKGQTKVSIVKVCKTTTTTNFANQSRVKQKFQLLKYAKPPQPPDKELWHPLVKPEGVTKPQENPLIQEPPLQQK
jgi:hypothetical protein